MPLHPEVEALRARRAAEQAPPLYTLSLAEARAADLADIRAAVGTGEPVAAVTEHAVPGPGGELRIRVYEPDDGRDRPALVYYFGGGWTLGNLETCDAICRALTNAAGCVTASVRARRASVRWRARPTASEPSRLRSRARSPCSRAGSPPPRPT